MAATRSPALLCRLAAASVVRAREQFAALMRQRPGRKRHAARCEYIRDKQGRAGESPAKIAMATAAIHKSHAAPKSDLTFSSLFTAAQRVNGPQVLHAVAPTCLSTKRLQQRPPPRKSHRSRR